MGGGTGLDGIDGDPDIAVRTVLESHGAGQCGGQLPVDLRLRGACPDGAPADEIGEIEKAGGVEEFGGGGEPQSIDVEQHLACQMQSPIDVVAAVQVRIEDQPFQPTVVRGFSK